MGFGTGVETGMFRSVFIQVYGLDTCKVGGVGSRSNLAPWILCSAVGGGISSMCYPQQKWRAL